MLAGIWAFQDIISYFHARKQTSPLTRSVLEPGRTLTLSEKGGGSGAAAEAVVVAAPGFRLAATMNPGGDFGKKELSPALANRFTSIWVPPIEDASELHAILKARLCGACWGTT